MGWWRMHLVPEKRTNRDSGCKLCWCLAATCLLSAIAPARFGDLHSTVAHCFEDVLKCCWSRAALVEDQQKKQSNTIKISVQHTGCFWNGVKLSITLTRSISALGDSKWFKAHSALHWILLDSCRSISSTRARSAVRDLTSEGSKNIILKETENLWLQRPSRISIYLILSPSSLASKWIKAKLRFGLQALLMLGSYLLAVCHCASSIWRPTQHSRTLLWRCFEVLLEQGCSRRRSTKQIRSKTNKISVQHTGCFWNGVKLSIKLTRSIFALGDSKWFNAHSALHWILLDSCRSISSTRARSAARDLISEGSKNIILKETENLRLQRPSRISIHLLLSPSSLASTWIKAKLRFGLQALLMLGSYLLAVCHCASSIWRPTQHSRTLLWRCFEVLLGQGCSRRRSTKTIKNNVQHTGCFWNGFKLSHQAHKINFRIGGFKMIQSTLSFALNPSGLLPLNLLYTSPFCCPWPKPAKGPKTSF